MERQQASSASRSAAPSGDDVREGEEEQRAFDAIGRYADAQLEAAFVESFVVNDLRPIMFVIGLNVLYHITLTITYRSRDPSQQRAGWTALAVGIVLMFIVLVAIVASHLRNRLRTPMHIEGWWAAAVLVIGIALTVSAYVVDCRPLTLLTGGNDSGSCVVPDFHGTLRFMTLLLGQFRFFVFVAMAVAFYVVEVPWRLWGPLPYRYSIATLHDVVVMVIVGILMFVADRRARAAFERHRRLWQSVREASRARHRVDAIIHSQVPAECLAPAEDDAEDGNGPPSGRTAGHAAAAAVVCVALHPPSAEATDWERFGADVEAVWSQLDSTLGALGAEKLLCDAAPLRFVATFGALRGGGAGDVARAGAAALEGLDALQAMRAAGGEGFLGGGSFSAAVAVGEVRWTVDLSRACGVVVEGAAVSEALRRSMVAPNGSIAVGSAVVSITGGRMSFAVLPGRVVVLTGMVSQAASDLGGGLVSSTSSAKLDTSSVSDASLASHLKAQRRAQNRARYARRQALLCVRVRDAAGAEFVAEHSHEVDLPWLRERLSQSSSRIGLGFDDADMETRYRAWRQGRFCAHLWLPMLLNAAYVGTLLVMLGVSAGSRAPVEAYALLGSGVAIALLAAVFSRRLHAVAGASVTYIVLVLVAAAMLAFPSVDPPNATPVVSIIAERPIVYFVAWVMLMEAQGPSGALGYIPLTISSTTVVYALLATVSIFSHRVTIRGIVFPLVYAALLLKCFYKDEREFRRQFLDHHVCHVADAALGKEREAVRVMLLRNVPHEGYIAWLHLRLRGMLGGLGDNTYYAAVHMTSNRARCTASGCRPTFLPACGCCDGSSEEDEHPSRSSVATPHSNLPSLPVAYSTVIVVGSRLRKVRHQVASRSRSSASTPRVPPPPESMATRRRDLFDHVCRVVAPGALSTLRRCEPDVFTQLLLVSLRCLGDTVLLGLLPPASAEEEGPMSVAEGAAAVRAELSLGVELVAEAVHAAISEHVQRFPAPAMLPLTVVHLGSARCVGLGSKRLALEMVGTAMTPLEPALSGLHEGYTWYSASVVERQEQYLGSTPRESLRAPGACRWSLPNVMQFDPSLSMAPTSIPEFGEVVHDFEGVSIMEESMALGSFSGLTAFTPHSTRAGAGGRSMTCAGGCAWVSWTQGRPAAERSLTGALVAGGGAGDGGSTSAPQGPGGGPPSIGLTSRTSLASFLLPEECGTNGSVDSGSWSPGSRSVTQELRSLHQETVHGTVDSGPSNAQGTIREEGSKGSTQHHGGISHPP